MPAAGAWTLEVRADNEATSNDFADWEPARAALDQLAAAVGGKAVEPDWVDAARSVEMAETIERSLHKGRNVDLHYEEYTEQGTFKGMMTSLGCGLLIAGLGLILVVGLTDSIARAMHRPIPLVEHWPYLLLGLLGLFLLLQLFALLFGKDEPRDRPPPDG
jgi:myo-inositol 2-dehydrogenase/D-chiro-inositol 1-dehydrogenase